MDGNFGPEYAKRVAWDITDPNDYRGLRAAAIAYGMEEVVKAIVEQTGVALQTRTEDSRLEVQVGTLNVGGGREIFILRTIYWRDQFESCFMQRV
jgi:hypothetical protein